MDRLRVLAQAIQDNPQVKVVITSRYLRALDESNELEKEIARYNLRPLTMAKTIQFIMTVCNHLNLTDRLIEDLKKSALFHEIPRSPIAAILLANLINENSKDLPSNLTELYSKYVEVVLGRWEIDKGLRLQKEYQALDNIMMNLARYMLENETVFISINEAKGFFKSYLETRNLNIDHNDLFQKVVDRSELMLVDYDKNTLAFKHRTFTEFFYAKATLRDKNMHVDQRAFTLYWMNSFFF